MPNVNSSQSKYQSNLKLRKLQLRALGWVERPNAHRCGCHWVHDKYKDSFSLKEAEKLTQLIINNEANN